MRETNTAFDTANALDYKTPVYLVHFDGETVDYVNHPVADPENTLKKYLIEIRGLSQKVIPEEGRASVGEITAAIQDYDDEITALLATDTYYFHRRKTVVKAGYAGMAESSMLPMTGWVTDIKMDKDLLAYELAISDPQRWLQRKIFRGAESETVTIQGNPLNLVLALLMSTGNGNNGPYDWYSSSIGLGIGIDYVNIENIERVRDDWYPGDSNYMKFTITKREKAKDWLEREIFKVLNIYPMVDGDGKFNLKPFKPPIVTRDTVQSFSEDNIDGLPRWDMNLKGLINEIEFHYDFNGSIYQTEEFYIETTSLNNRGPGRKPLAFKSRGVHTSNSPGSVASRANDIIGKRKTKAFGRWAVPPLKLNISTFFSRWVSEPGDIVPVTHRKVPDPEAGTRGITSRRMEVINRSINWKQGRVNIELVDSGFDRGRYSAISPRMIVTEGVSTTQFMVSDTDAAKYEVGWVVDIFDQHMHLKASNLTITAITSMGGVGFEDTGAVEFEDTVAVQFESTEIWQVTVDSSIGATPAAGWIVLFSDYANCVSAQQLYSFIYKSGGAMSEPVYISP